MLSIPNPVQSTAVARPLHTVLTCGDVSLTATELRDAVRVRAGRLRELGVRAGDAVLLVGAPSLDFVIAVHAIGWLGAIVAPVGPAAPRDELARACALFGPVAAVLDVDVLEEHGALLHGFVGEQLTTFAALAQVPASHVPLALVRQPSDSAPAVRDLASDGLPAEHFWPLEEVRLFVLTSGTTAAAKVVPVTTAQIVFGAFGSSTRLGHALDDMWLCCLPLHHIGGLSILFRAALNATCVQLMLRFDATALAALLDAGDIALVSLVPRQLDAVLDAREDVPFAPGLRAILLGGAAPGSALLARCRRIKAPLAVTWGMSETAAQVATAFAGEIGLPGDCGPALPFARIGERGERLTVTGMSVQAPLVTSDRGHVSDDGHVHVAGRGDDVIISGGEKLSPDEIEDVLRRHPAVRDVAVVPVRDAKWGQRPLAALVAVSGMRLPDDAELGALCRHRLQRFKVPAHYVWCPALPRDGLGKLRRREVLNALGLDASGAALKPSGNVPGGSSAVALGRESQAFEAVAERLRDGGLALQPGVDAGVDQRDPGTLGIVGADDAVAAGHGALSQTFDFEGDVEPLAQANGVGEVGLGVDEGHGPQATLERGFQRPEEGRDQFLESGVTVLEEAPKEDDSRAVDFVEAHGDVVVKSHGANR